MLFTTGIHQEFYLAELMSYFKNNFHSFLLLNKWYTLNYSKCDSIGDLSEYYKWIMR